MSTHTSLTAVYGDEIHASWQHLAWPALHVAIIRDGSANGSVTLSLEDEHLEGFILTVVERCRTDPGLRRTVERALRAMGDDEREDVRTPVRTVYDVHQSWIDSL